MVGRIAFDERMVAEIERALAARTDEERTAVPHEAPQASAAEERLRSAIAALKGDADLVDLRKSLESKQLALESDTLPMRRAAKTPGAVFRAAVASITRWPEAWASATPAEKNAVLRAAGLRAFIEPIHMSTSQRSATKGS